MGGAQKQIRAGLATAQSGQYHTNTELTGVVRPNTWAIWSERNKQKHEQQQRSPEQIKSWSLSYFEEIKKVYIPNVEAVREAITPNGDQGLVNC